MKKRQIMAIIMVITTVGCSMDPQDSEKAENEINASMRRSTTSFPANPENPYDTAGELYYQISEAYHKTGKTVSNNAELILDIEQLASRNEVFNSFVRDHYSSISTQDLDVFLLRPYDYLDGLVNSTKLSQEANLNLRDFISAMCKSSAKSGLI
jgi:hypothetical protein